MHNFFVLLLTTMISLVTFSAHASSDNYDIYINDNGERCMLLIDVATLKINANKLQQQPVQQKIRKYLVSALKTIDQEKCVSSIWEASAIIVGKRDPYGQPNWSDVVTLQRFNVDPKKLQSIHNKNLTHVDINQVITSKTGVNTDQ